MFSWIHPNYPHYDGTPPGYAVHLTETCEAEEPNIITHFDIRFAPTDCRACAYRSDCTRSKRGVQVILLKPQAEYEALQAARAWQETDEFKAKYKKQAGVEGTISQDTRSFALRRSRYIGLAKTHLQHLATAAAMNLTRVVAWLMDGPPKAQTRRSSFAALAPAT